MGFGGCLGTGGKSSPTNGDSKVRRRRYAVAVDGRRARLTVDVPTAAYKRAQEQPRSLSRAIASARSSELLHQLGRQIAAGYETNGEQLLAAQAAVASITYATDAASTGTGEYVRYPVETLTEQTGDCEDVAILLAGLPESPAIGFQACLVFT
jgi:predicted transglutaminase-like cysteine proteinase